MKRDPRFHLRDIDQAAAEIVGFMAGTDFEGFLGNPMMQRAVERDLEIIGDVLNRLEGDAPVVQSALSELDRDLPAPDRSLADDVLVLSCAVSERVSADDPVRRDSLPLNIQDVLRSTALATHVREDEVSRIASGISRKRAETDLRVAATREIGIGEIFEVRARFDGNPDYLDQSDIDAYKASVAKGMRRLHREEPVPAEIERRVARAVVATHGAERHGLALAMAEALERGTTPTADGIRNERKALIAELQEGPKSRETFEERSLLRRIYRNFIAAEVRELSRGADAALDGLPDEAAREQAVKEVQQLHRKSWSTEPSPWQARHRTLARSFGAERGRGRERGRYRGAERG